MVSLDHIDVHTMEQNGLYGEREMLVICDLATDYLGAFPVPSKSAEHVTRWLSFFAGSEPIKEVYSDRAPELMAGVRAMPGGGPVHTTSVPGCPQTNSIIESRVKRVIRGTRALLHAAGLPHCWWVFAAKCYAHLHNLAAYGDEAP